MGYTFLFIFIKVLTSFVGIFLVLNCRQVILLQINSVPCMNNSLKPTLCLWHLTPPLETTANFNLPQLFFQRLHCRPSCFCVKRRGNFNFFTSKRQDCLEFQWVDSDSTWMYLCNYKEVWYCGTTLRYV